MLSFLNGLLVLKDCKEIVTGSGRLPVVSFSFQCLLIFDVRCVDMQEL